MTNRRKIIIPRIKGRLIERVDLISIEEYKKWRTIMAKIDRWWWLQSPGISCRDAAYVYRDGSISDFGYRVHYSSGGVVPALYLKSSNLIIGGKYYVIINDKKIKATAVENNILITDKPIAFCRFDKYANYYKKSEIKQRLNRWQKNIV